MKFKAWFSYAILIFLGMLIMLSMVSCMVTQPFVKPEPSTPPDVDAKALEKHVRYLSETLYPRSPDQPEKLNAAAEYIREQFKISGAIVSDQPYRIDSGMVRNIIGRYGPKDGSVLIIGAHYDSHSTADYQNSSPYSLETHTPGADDNASGVAGLLELARLLQQHPPEIPVELVAYTLEEPPYFRTDSMGSVVHAQNLRETKQPVEMMISLEMIGYFADEPGSQQYPVGLLRYLYSDKADFIAIIGRMQDRSQTRKVKAAMSGATDLPVFSMNANSFVMGVDFSDHRSYWAKDINAVMITDTAFFRNQEYHRAGDTADRLDYQRMAKVVQGVFALIASYKND